MSTNALSGIFKNPIVKAALLKQLKKLWKDNNIKLITITENKNGELDFIPYTEEMKVVPKKDFDTLLKSVLE